VKAPVSTEWDRLVELIEGPCLQRSDRHQQLLSIFEESSSPNLTRGSYRGVLAGGYNLVVDGIGARVKKVWMPWVGKHLEPDEQRGYNLLRPRSERVLQRFLGSSPTYPCGKLTAAYEFGYRLGPSALPGGQEVGRIEYADVPTNPDFLRRMHDEVAEVAPGILLGRFIATSGGQPRITAWFALHGPVTAPRVERLRVA
jgi:hypothetical protein